MKIKYLSKVDAKNQMGTWKENDRITNYELDDAYAKLQFELTHVFNQYRGKDIASFDFDAYFGLELHRILLSIDQFSLREASRDDFWNYLSIQVVPKIVAARWGRDNEGRFYAHARRIYLKTIFWFIELAWQGDYVSTADVLKYCNTDTVVQIGERVNRGYDFDLTRTILKHFATSSVLSNRNLFFRSIMKINTAYIKTIDPKMFNGGYEGYVTWLFDYVSEGM